MANPPNKNVRSKQAQSYLNKRLGKLPPQATDLEDAILGALMLEKDALLSVGDILHPESFYKEANKEIYKAIQQLSANSQPIDMLTVTQQLRKTGMLEFVGGASYVTSLASYVNSAAHIESHARIVAEAAIKREIIALASDLERDAYEDSIDVFDLLDAAEQRFFEISERNITKKTVDIQLALQEAIQNLENKKGMKDGLTGIPSGFMHLDRITAGWQKTDFVVIAARPSVGKTAFALNLLRNAAIDFNFPVAFFSLEMSTTQLVHRLISIEAELEGDKIKKGTLADYEWQQLYTRIPRLADAKIFLDDTPNIPINELNTKARRLKSQHDIQMIIIDYLQLITASNIFQKSSVGNREQEVAYISRSLKKLAKDLDIPVIALSQLSRAVETRGGEKRPQLSDIRESGSVEQDADIVLFLYRPEYHQITADSMGNSTLGLAEVLISKHRNGALGEVQLQFVGKYSRFRNLEAEEFQQFQATDPQSEGGFTTFSSRLNQINSSANGEDGDFKSYTAAPPPDDPPF
ncbi:MAG: replicative DNA helicase [Cytophagales bacterium]|nr:MAG: replicative DNA helicase [Cytophagales bacterium]